MTSIHRTIRISTPNLLRRMLLAWLWAVVIEYFLLPIELRDLSGLAGLAQMSFARVMGLTAGITLLLTVLAYFAKLRTVERWGIVVAFGVLGFEAWRSSGSWPFYWCCALLMAILMVFAMLGWNKSREVLPGPQKASKAYPWITAGMAVAFFLFVSAWTVGRIYVFGTPTYDFGIFAQMFHSMKTSGLPMTTVERDGLLSHFAVHVSPIYYLMLPFYWLVPEPATLQVLQAAVLASAVIPLWLICKHRGLTGLQRMLICTVLLLAPAYSGGTSYDIHENCFLTPLLLWLFYGIDNKNWKLASLFAALTLMVKEDAAVYVLVIALWLAIKTLLKFRRCDRQAMIFSISLLVVGLCWFFAATGYLAQKGDGVMTYRYSNFMYDGSSSLITVVKSVFLNPMKAVYECMDAEKLSFICWTLLPLLGLPLLTRRYERYILLIPYLLVNLMSDYKYQHDIFFQYTFGSMAFLMYMTVVNLADLKINRLRSVALIVAVSVSVVCFGTAVAQKGIRYPVQAVKYYDYYQSIRDTLDTVPDDASVTSSGFYTTYLSQRDILYDFTYCSWEHLMSTDYIVLQISAVEDYKKFATFGQDNGLDNLLQILEENGYSEYTRLDRIMVIYARASSPS